MRDFSEKYKSEEKALKTFNKAVELVGPCNSTGIVPCSGGIFKETGFNFFNILVSDENLDFKVQLIMNRDKDKKIELFKTIKEFKNLISKWISDWNQDMKKQISKAL